MFGLLTETAIVLSQILLCSFLGLTNLTADTIQQPAPVAVSGVMRQYASQNTQASAATGCPNPYIVRRGDTLAKIASRCGVSVTTLKRWNGLRSNTIWVGRALTTRSVSRQVPVAPRYSVTPQRLVVPAPTPCIESTVSPW